MSTASAIEAVGFPVFALAQQTSWLIGRQRNNFMRVVYYSLKQ
jgi:hypothetical protein